ncbi:MAG: UPF0182 family protein [Candidatus Margulisbacteria bacterium]|nr:UPF0182 family protein [Candidatus Margulisiibacteriota bacterium]
MFYIYGIILFFLLALPVFRALINIYPDYLWFVDLGYQNVFFTIWSARLIPALIFTIVAFIIVYFNLFITLKNRKKIAAEPEVVYDNGSLFNINSLPFEKTAEILDSFKWLKIVIAAFIAIIFGGFWLISWDKVLFFLNSQLLGKTDPVFHKDIGFYFFTYPFLKLLQSWLMSLSVVVLIITLLGYIHRKSLSIKGLKIEISPHIKLHVSVLLGIIFMLIAWLYKLNMYQLLYTSSGLVYGPGYTVIHADLLGYNALFIMSLIIVGLIFINIFRKGIMLPLEGFAVMAVIYILLKGVYPVVLQQLIVKPNEIEKERPYINYYIKYTQDSYGLSSIQEKILTINPNLTVEDMKRNQDTVTNIRLWDHRPLLKTLEQLQEIRLYYNFYDVDVDRYWVNGKYQQVMLSARELDADQLPAQARNWINQKLTYTHGKGVVMLPVNKMTSEGLPDFYINDVPPKINVDIQLENSSIYFGESTNKYIITNTKAKEFDYPQGDSNQYTEYSGPKGIVLNNFLRKLLFAIKFREMNIVFTDTITPKSKIFFDRSIRTRVEKIAPFLSYDNDPYVIVANKKLYWIMDAYTVSSMYPYAQPFYGSVNYIRNPVKVVIDAYTGETGFYVIDDKEPIIATYKKVFPTLFKSVKELSPEIIAHFRYPEDLFVVQAKMFGTFHMTDPQVFYNQEDLWVVANETYADNVKPMEPYYTMMKLPEDKKLSFRLMLPFTPSKKNNMIGWMSANSDYPDYGKITVYKMPKEQLIYGPIQIESRIDQDTEISKQLTLWGQKGSQVIRGNLLVVPVENSFLYVEPLYLQATQSKIPELKRIVVAFGNKLAMEATFEEALMKVFNSNVLDKVQDTIKTKGSGTQNENGSSQLINEAGRAYNEAQQAIKALDWKTYGEQMRRLGSVLEQLRNKN